MTRFIPTTAFGRTVTLTFALSMLGACGKKSQQPPATETSGGAIAPANGAVQVADVTLGRGVSADKHVATPTNSFSPHDTIAASVHTTGSASSVAIAARWTYQDGQLVNERTETISPNGDAFTEFHISKPSGWPAGNYTLHILVNGQEVQTKDFTVK